MTLTDEELDLIVDRVCQRLEVALITKPLGVSELAEFLKVEKSWVYGQRDLPHFFAGKHKRFMVADVLNSLGYRNKPKSAQEVSDADDIATSP